LDLTHPKIQVIGLLDLNQVGFFVEVVRAGSFAAAA
jgi:hypothetical protein